MHTVLGNTEEILSSISGFHQYILTQPVHLAYVSKSFCEMMGCEEEELLNPDNDVFASFIHPADIEIYNDFISELVHAEQTITVQYRVILRDGTVRHINDTATSKRLEDGTLVGNSSLIDITPVKTESDNMHFLRETIPFGFLRYTCEKYPKITYINDQILDIIRLPKSKEGEVDYLEMYKDNIYLMLPIEERGKFAHFLDKVSSQHSPLAGEITILRCDGTKARVYGWVAKSTNKNGEEEFHSVCMDITEKYQMEKAGETERYLKALSDVYDQIFEYDFTNQTVKYLHGQNSNVLRAVQNVPMHLEEATRRWVDGNVIESDREKVSRFFDEFCKQEVRDSSNKPSQVKYRVLSSDGILRTYIGIFLKMDSDVSFFCCKSVAENPENDSLRNENASLRNMNENMRDFVMRFTDGVVAFEVENDNVKPLYTSENVCQFFGYTDEEWIQLAQEKHSIKDFVANSAVDYEEFMELFENGEAEFEYIDVKTQTPHRIKAVCSNLHSDGSQPQYVMLYNANEEVQPRFGFAEAEEKGHIYIRTFGYFDVFVDEKPIAFRNKKSKELFALLVDRRGGFVSSEEAISFLWEDEPVNSVTLARYRKVALRLKNILEEYGIADIVEAVDGKRRVDTDLVQCDLYDYLSQKEEYAQLFKGSYLTNYSWGETTLGELLNEHMM